MISELTFIRQYGNFWNQLLPGIDHFIRLINSGIKERVYTPISIRDIPYRRALINSISFKAFYYVNLGEYNTIESLIEDKIAISKIKQTEIDKLKVLDNKDLFEDELNSNELEIIRVISNRLLAFFKLNSPAIIYPKFPGCGLILKCSGDVYTQENLYEIKAGDSNFKKQDIFQLLLYCALNSVSRNSLSIKNISLFNPRNGLLWTDNINNVAIITSGYSSIELYGEILNYIGNNYQSI